MNHLPSIALLFTSLLFTVAACAQTDESQKSDELKTLIKSDKTHHGGFFALDFKYGEYETEPYVMAGMRTGWVINHSFTIGFAGYGIIPEVQLSGKHESRDVYLYGGYGGLLFEPTIFPKSPVHITLPVVLGAGTLFYDPNVWYDGIEDWDNDNYDIFFVAEPSIQIEVSLVKFVRIAAGAGYRFTNKVNLPNTETDVFDGLNAGLTLKFGSF